MENIESREKDLNLENLPEEPAEAKAQEEKVSSEAESVSEKEPERQLAATSEGKTEENLKESEVEPKVEQETISSAKLPAPPPQGERKWYVVQTLTGQEDKAKQAIELTIQDQGLQDRIFQVLVPMEETVEIKGGKRVEKVRKMFPGYVFLEMILDEKTWFLIRQTPGVARFIGTKVQPTPVSDKEMQRVLKQLGKEEKLEVTFEKGEAVRVISGPFRGYTGTVDEINVEKGKLKVLINIFGRDTPVEVNFEHAQKIV
ncbi:MAG: transcription termination/antitermination protein NusG [Candidatus Margulisiibacteriota bacterium]